MNSFLSRRSPTLLPTLQPHLMAKTSRSEFIRLRHPYQSIHRDRELLLQLIDGDHMVATRIGLDTLSLRSFHQKELHVEGRTSFSTNIYNTYIQDLTWNA